MLFFSDQKGDRCEPTMTFLLTVGGFWYVFGGMGLDHFSEIVVYFLDV